MGYLVSEDILPHSSQVNWMKVIYVSAYSLNLWSNSELSEIQHLPHSCRETQVIHILMLKPDLCGLFKAPCLDSHAYFVLLHAVKVDFKANTEYVIKVQF